MKYFSVKTVSEKLGVTERSVRRMCCQGQLPGAKKVKSEWSIPEISDARLIVRQIGQKFEITDFARVPKPKQDAAIRKLGIIKQFEKFSGTYVRHGGQRSEALEIFCHERKIAPSTFKRWLRKNRKYGVMGLVDTRGGNGRGSYSITQEAWDEFTHHYLDLKQPSVRSCWLSLEYINKTQKCGWKIPSLRRMQQLVHERIPYPTQVLCREGESAYTAKCSPFAIVDYESIKPGSCWVGDHHQTNLFVLHKGDWVRPWITAWMDMRSRCVVGVDVNTGPNQVTILRAFKKAAKKYGLPEIVKIDNGKDYDSKMWTGITKKQRKSNKEKDEVTLTGLYNLLGIRTSFALPYNARAKSIERWFHTLDMQFSKSFATYCGKKISLRPENLNRFLKSKKAVCEAVSLEAYANLLDKYIEVYNNTPHTGRGMDGRTPKEVFSTRKSKRVVLNGTLDLICQVWTTCKVGKNGVKVKGMWYGQYAHQLIELSGKTVRISYDPDDLRAVRVFDEDWKFVCLAEQADLSRWHKPVSDDHVRNALAEQRRFKKIVKQYRGQQCRGNMKLSHLAMAAQQDMVKPLNKHSKDVYSKPVATSLDLEAMTVKRREQQLKLKKAVEIENEKLNINWDLSEFEPIKYKPITLGLFDNYE